MNYSPQKVGAGITIFFQKEIKEIEATSWLQSKHQQMVGVHFCRPRNHHSIIPLWTDITEESLTHFLKILIMQLKIKLYKKKKKQIQGDALEKVATSSQGLIETNRLLSQTLNLEFHIHPTCMFLDCGSKLLLCSPVTLLILKEPNHIQGAHAKPQTERSNTQTYHKRIPSNPATYCLV